MKKLEKIIIGTAAAAGITAAATAAVTAVLKKKKAEKEDQPFELELQETTEADDSMGESVETDTGIKTDSTGEQTTVENTAITE